MKKGAGAIITITLTAILLFFYYSHQIINANHLNYGQWGDGYKNFYTISYYLKHDNGTHFTGMNYPYGENVVFTDNQPIIAWLLKFLSIFFPFIINHIHAYLAGVIFFSVVISAFFLYKTLIEFEVSELHAALFGSLIALLSPQIVRLHGHYALGYTCFIPILLFLLVRYFKTNGRLKVFFFITSTLTFFAFIHIYYLAMGSFFVLLIACVFSLSKISEIKKHIRFIGFLFISAVIPFFILKSYLLLTDHVNDRPHSPWGFVSSRSTVADILLHPYSFTGEVIGQLFPKANIAYHFEGSGYIGLVTLITLLIVLILSIVSFSEIKKVSNWYLLNIFMITAFVVLLFAMAFPFSIDGLEPYYTKMPSAVKQFRASGRFNWIFYYTATLYAAVFISHLFRYLYSKKKYILYTLLVCSVYAIWFIEMNMIAVRNEKDFKANSNYIDDQAESDKLHGALQSNGKNSGNFQAILSFPFFLNGSEKLYIESGGSFEAMKASLFTGLPLIDTKMSRTSESQAFSIANLLSSDYIRKDIIRKFPGQKPLLMLTSGNDFMPVERKLISKARLLFTDGDNRFYELPLSAFSDSIDVVKSEFAYNRTRLISHGDYSSFDSTNNVIVKRFEDQPKGYTVFGKGAEYVEHGVTYFYYDTLPAAQDSTPYEMSAWVYSDERRAAFPVIYMTQIDSSGKEVQKYETNPKFSTNTFGKWVRGEIDFTLYKKTNKILLMADDYYGTYDEVMMRPMATTVITGIENDSTFIYNNYPIR